MNGVERFAAFSLDGRVAVVTGAGGGLGARIAVALAEAGARVILVGRRAERLAETAGEIIGAGGVADCHVVDVRDPAATAALFERLTENGGSLDILVNNAGVVHQAPVLEVTPSDWAKVMDTNLLGTFACSQAFARQPSDRDRVIINVSSIAAVSGVRGQIAYSASKGGVEALTRSLAIEFARRRIRVNALAPGYMRTEMPAGLLADPAATDRLLRKIPLERIADPAEVAPAAVFLASDASSYMTGAVLAVDGGYGAQ